MTFKVAIIGRPNVGKSTLFNRLVGRKLALVDDTPGVTRDRRVHAAKLYDLHFDVIDTAGFEDAAASTLPGRMRAQTEIAIREADLIFFTIDAKSGLLPDDRTFAEIVRKSGKPVVLVANKAEAKGAQGGMLEAWELGLGEPIPVSAAVQPAHKVATPAAQNQIAAAQAFDEIVTTLAFPLVGAGSEDEPIFPVAATNQVVSLETPHGVVPSPSDDHIPFCCSNDPVVSCCADYCGLVSEAGLRCRQGRCCNPSGEQPHSDQNDP